jgi:hypothetical protein
MRFRLPHCIGGHDAELLGKLILREHYAVPFST